MLLVFDIGNTQIVCGLFDQTILIADWRLQSDRQKTADEYGILFKSILKDASIDTKKVTAAVISSVVPPVTGIIEQMIEKYFNTRALQIGPGVKNGLTIKYENPREIGADRVVNAVAGIKLYGAPLIIIDLGTATTFCAINKNGEYLGGAIAPGIAISSEALFQRTAKLPRIEFAKPKSVIGKNTTQSMQSGLYYGYLGLIERMIDRIKLEMRCEPQVIATGNLFEEIVGDIQSIDIVNQYLTLEGLRFIYEMNI